VGIVGSITHTRSFACAAAADASVVRSVGIDTERRLPDDEAAGVRSVVFVPTEAEGNASLAPGTNTSLVFSAKESLFKCLSPLVPKTYWFEAARIVVDDPEARRFEATLLCDWSDEFRAGMCLSGRFELAPDLIHTGLVLPRG
jgi:enterobactin synthetase component D